MGGEMLILLEGLGRTGKTTLAQRLCADLPAYHYIHFSVPDRPNAMEYFRERLGDAVAEHGEHLILDRFHWSNHAYGDRFGGSVLTDSDFCWLDLWLAERRVAALLLVDDPRAILRRMADTIIQEPEKRVLTSMAEIGEIQNRFYLCFDRSAISLKWALGLDQLFDLDTDDQQPTAAYRRLLTYIQSDGREVEE